MRRYRYPLLTCLLLFGIAFVFWKTAQQDAAKPIRSAPGGIALRDLPTKNPFPGNPHVAAMADLLDYMTFNTWEVTPTLLAQMTVLHEIYTHGDDPHAGDAIVASFAPANIPPEMLTQDVSRQAIHNWIDAHDLSGLSMDTSFKIRSQANSHWGIYGQPAGPDERAARVLVAQKKVLQCLRWSQLDSAESLKRSYISSGIAAESFDRDRMRQTVIASLVAEIAATADPRARRDLLLQSIHEYNFTTDELVPPAP